MMTPNYALLTKAKRKDNDEWVVGFFSQYPNEITGFLRNYIFIPDYNVNDECGTCVAYEVKSDTVSRCTGVVASGSWFDASDKEKEEFLYMTKVLMDKVWQYTSVEDVKQFWKGKLIWENDVVALDSLDGFVVEYDAENARFIFNGEHKDADYGYCGFHLYSQKEIKISGNRFDNPELLEKEPPRER